VQRQGVIFRFPARLMMTVPGATIHTLMRFMEEPDATRARADFQPVEIELGYLMTHFAMDSFPDSGADRSQGE
jgi:hypothetical protein